MTNGTTTVDYRYNSDGIRTKKTVTTASNHTHVFQDTVIAPTCTENGYTLHSCICGYIYQDSPVAATGHTYTASVIADTCTTNGYTLYTCACGNSYQDGASGHTFTTLVVEPSETINGFTLHQCDCGYSYESDPVASLAGAGDNTETVSDVRVYDYVYNGSSLTRLTITTTITGHGTSTKELYFTYDGSSPMTVTYGDDIFYYVTNLQGDVIAILNTNGVAVVTYTYDAWGNILDIDGSMKDDLGVANPFTYRGYVYDTESGLYYLQSRYYNANVGRFINADTLVATGQGWLGNNMFAYALNNPINYADSDGKDAVWVQEESNVGTMGHSGLLVYDPKTKKWYYFFWGASDGSGLDGWIFGTAPTYYLLEVNSDGRDFTKTEDVTAAVTEALSSLKNVSKDFIATRSKITDTCYFTGDYQATYDYLVTLWDRVEQETMQYNVSTNNCGQVSWRAMSKSNVYFRMMAPVIIPNAAYCHVAMFECIAS